MLYGLFKVDRCLELSEEDEKQLFRHSVQNVNVTSGLPLSFLPSGLNTFSTKAM